MMQPPRGCWSRDAEVGTSPRHRTDRGATPPRFGTLQCHAASIEASPDRPALSLSTNTTPGRRQPGDEERQRSQECSPGDKQELTDGDDLLRPYIRQTSAQLQRALRRATGSMQIEPGGSPVSNTRLTRLAGAPLAVAVAAAVTIGGPALAHGGHHHANRGRSYHAANASAPAQPSACPVAPNGGSPPAGHIKSGPPPAGVEQYDRLGPRGPRSGAPSGPGPAEPKPCRDRAEAKPARSCTVSVAQK